MDRNKYKFGITPKVGDVVRAVPHKVTGLVVSVGKLDQETIVEVLTPTARLNVSASDCVKGTVKFRPVKAPKPDEKA